MATDLLQTLMSLGLVLGLIFGLGWLARRLQQLRGSRGETVQIEGGVQLGTREKLVLVRVQGQQFLIGVAPGQVQLVHRFPAATAGKAQVFDFSEHLKARP